MESSQQFNLRWNNYLSHISTAFDSLRNQEEFVDVTLSCEGKKIKAHRLLLSACSNYFRDIFMDNACPHPVIVFQNIKYEDLLGLITFMYQGQVNVEQDCLQSFLNTAELLEVQGLTTIASKNKVDDECESLSDVSLSGGGQGRSSEAGSDIGPPRIKRRRSRGSNKITIGGSDHGVVGSTGSKTAVPVDDERLALTSIDASAVTTDDDEDNRLAVSEDNSLTNHSPADGSAVNNGDPPTAASITPTPPHANPPSSILQDSLNDSGTGSGNDMQESLQGIFSQGLWRRLDPSLKRFNCDVCGKVFKHPRSLDHHKKMHEGRTTCPVCFRVFGRMYALRLHMTASHPAVDIATVIH